MESSKVVGEGTYGCVHQPPLNCKGKNRPPNNKVTKLMRESEAKNELKEYNVMEYVDPQKQYYLGTPESCKVDINTYNKRSAEKCKKLKKNEPQIIDNLSEYMLLVMENGGDNLETFAEKAGKWKSADRFQKIDRFWLEGHRMFMGIKAFLNNGVIHHDLKPQNIVYNEATGRMNFIDFGLMVHKSDVINQAEKSKYDLSIYHWSFPLDCKFLNKKVFDKYAKYSEKFKTDHLKSIAGSLKEGGGTDGSDAIRFFLFYTTNERGNTFNRETTTLNIFKNFGETLLHQVTPSNYETMVEETLDTIDIYGLGLAFMNVLKSVNDSMDVKVVDDMKKLFLEMTDANVSKRIGIDTAINKYEDILEKHNILKKFNMHFKNHILTEGPLMPAVLEKKIEKASAESPQISAKEIKKMLTEDPEALEPKSVKKRLIVRTNECSEGKELHPNTRRCVKKCKAGEMRNERFECRKTQRKWKKRKGE
jgi:serine/threonine protein kinase